MNGSASFSNIVVPNLPGYGLNQRDSWVTRQLAIQSGVQPPVIEKLGGRPRTSAGTVRGTSVSFESTSFQSLRNTASLQNLFKGTQNPETESVNPQKTQQRQEQPHKTSYIFQRRGSMGMSKSMPVLPPGFKDNTVLRFLAHFFQPRNWDDDAPIGTPTIEETIARCLVVAYYLEDDTMEMWEDKTANSGFSGGTFFKRHSLADKNGKKVALDDLIPGKSIHVLGQELFITDADISTRDYLRELPKALKRPVAFQTDASVGLGAMYATGLASTAVRKSPAGKASDPNSQLEKAETARLVKFQKYAGRILSFIAVELPIADPFDPDSQKVARDFVPNTRSDKFIVMYYMDDGCMEIRAMKTAREDARIVMKKSKLQRNWDHRFTEPPDYFEPTDFVCGKKINIYGRLFLLVSCNSDTRSIFRDFGIPQVDVELEPYVEKTYEHTVPERGVNFLPIGSEENTLQTVFGHKQSKKQLYMTLRNANKKLSCEIRLVQQRHRNPIDHGRDFSLTFFIEDDSIFIFETVKRNSGVMGGTFLKRGKYLNELPPENTAPRTFKPTDIYLGNVFSVSGHVFEIVKLDEMSSLYCESNPHHFPYFDTFGIINRICRSAISMQLNIRRLFAEADPTHEGVVVEASFVSILDAAGLLENFNDQEVATFLRRFKDAFVDKLHYFELTDLIARLNAAEEDVDDDISDLESMLPYARNQPTQWRRVFRKDRDANGKWLPLGRLCRIFNKHKVEITATVRNQLASLYSNTACPLNVSQRRETIGRMLKKSSPMPFSNSKPLQLETKRRASVDLFDSKGTNKSHGSNYSSIVQEARSRYSGSNMFGRTMPQISEHTQNGAHMNNPEQTQIAATSTSADDSTPIDYDALCDDIYACEWMNPVE